VLRTAAAIFNQQTEGRSNRDKQIFSKAMGHSEATNQLYNKIIPKVNERDIQVKKGNKILIKEEPIETNKQEATPVQKTPKVLKPAEKIGNVRRSKRLNR